MITPFHIENIQTSQDDFQAARWPSSPIACARPTSTSAATNGPHLDGWECSRCSDRLSKTHRDRDLEFRKLIDVVGFGIPLDEPQARKPAQRRRARHPAGRFRDYLVRRHLGLARSVGTRAGGACAHQADPRIKLLFSMYRRRVNEQPTQTAQSVRNLAVELGAGSTNASSSANCPCRSTSAPTICSTATWV